MASDRAKDPDSDLQTPFDAAVVIPTILRPELLRAVRSIYRQDLDGRIQVLVGIDKPRGAGAVIDQLRHERPQNCRLTVLDPGYSTSRSHGGIHSANDGGSLRTVLSFLANSRYVAYLDDDNWWAPNHLSSLLRAIGDKAWAHSLRWLVDQETGKRMAVDRWHSVGVDAGDFEDDLGGFADPSTILVDKLQCASGLHLWSTSLEDFSDADRRFFSYLARQQPGASSLEPTCYYLIRRDNVLWMRMAEALGLVEPEAKDAQDATGA